MQKSQQPVYKKKGDPTPTSTVEETKKEEKPVIEEGGHRGGENRGSHRGEYRGGRGDRGNGRGNFRGGRGGYHNDRPRTEHYEKKPYYQKKGDAPLVEGEEAKPVEHKHKR
jgi:hypothetical protein